MTHLTTEQIEAMPRTYLDTLTRKLAAAQEGNTMTQFADDFEITQDQADTLNARIAAGEEYAELYGDINEHRAEPTGEEAPTMQTTTTTKQSQQEEALHTLREMIQEGQTVYATETQHHFMRFFIVSNRDGQLVNITWHVGKALGHSVREHGYGNRWHVYRKGAGTSLPNATVQGLAHTLFGDSNALRYSDI